MVHTGVRVQCILVLLAEIFILSTTGHNPDDVINTDLIHQQEQQRLGDDESSMHKISPSLWRHVTSGNEGDLAEEVADGDESENDTGKTETAPEGSFRRYDRRRFRAYRGDLGKRGSWTDDGLNPTRDESKRRTSRLRGDLGKRGRSWFRGDLGRRSSIDDDGVDPLL